MGASEQTGEIYKQKKFYTPFLSNSPTGQTAHYIFTLDGSNDPDSCKGVPFLAFVDIEDHLGDKIPPKPQFWVRKYAFSRPYALNIETFML